MSSEDEGPSRSGISHKKKRGRACDQCRQKKVRCDGAVGKRCSNCATTTAECTYVGQAKKRYPDVAHLESLEIQVANLKKLLNKLHPGVDFSNEINGVQNGESLWRVEPVADSPQSVALSPPHQPSLPAVPAPKLSLSPSPPAEHPIEDYNELDLQSSDEETTQHLLHRASDINRSRSGRPRFMGKSSRLMFVKQALQYKNYSTGGDPNASIQLHWTPHNRPEFWRRQQWVQEALQPGPPHPGHVFPPDELMHSLVDIYFTGYNNIIPLLHRPTFEENVRQGLHRIDESFGNVVLLVCALAARFSTDHRVLLEEEYIANQKREGPPMWQSAGWAWFRQAATSRKIMSFCPPNLYDLQMACLAAAYLNGTSGCGPAWAFVGMALRWAQEMGIHRKKMYSQTPSIESEQLKRTFWVLVTLDRSMSAGFGRACSIQDEDFDLDNPIECDDEYWVNDDPALAFKQPPGKPSKITAFVLLLRLKAIHAFAMRTIYATNKSKLAKGYLGLEFDQHIVAELDSTLNSFVDSIPDHLRWDPHREDPVFFNQSALLHASYYMLQISVHRPYIPSPRKPSPLSFPSLAICTNAARSCIHVSDIQFKRAGSSPVFQNPMALFTSGIVLLLNIWGGKLSGSSPNVAKEMQEVHKVMDMLKAQEPRWFVGGRYWDILHDMATFGDLPLPESGPSLKRTREDETMPPSDHSSPASTTSETSRPIAGTRRVHVYQQQHADAAFSSSPSDSPGSMSGSSNDFALPIHSAELGSLPLHSAFDHLLRGANFGGWAPNGNGNGNGLHMGMVPAPTMMPLTNGFVPSAMGPPVSYAPQMSVGATDVSQHARYFQGQNAALPAVPDGGGSLESMMAAVNMVEPGPALNAASPFAGYSDNDTLAMWSTAPAGFEWDDWGSFLSTMNANSSGAFDSSTTV